MNKKNNKNKNELFKKKKELKINDMNQLTLFVFQQKIPNLLKKN